MALTNDISKALERIRSGQAQPADLERLQQAAAQGGIVVDGDASHSVLIVGEGNTVEQRFELTPQALRHLLRQIFIPVQAGSLPFGSYLPFPRNAIFTGRQADLDQLAAFLLDAPQDGAALINQALTHGMGGIGKTQLAVEFAYRYGQRFRGVHWLDLSDPSQLNAQIALCGARMGFPDWDSSAFPEQVSQTRQAWSQERPRLLILDNFEEVGAANRILADLGNLGARLLITSRRSDWQPALGLRPLPLNEFSPQEARDFLRRYLPAERADDAALDDLSAHLGHLPLALELAGRYLQRLKSVGVDEYLAQLSEALEHVSMRNWKPEQASPTGHDLSLLQTFALSWERLQDNAAAGRLFMACGYCAPNTPIPAPVLRAALGAHDQAETLDEALAALQDWSLLKENNLMHPLLAQFARRQDADHALLAQFSQALGKLAVETNHEVDRTGDYARYQPLAPHVYTVAEHAQRADLTGAGRLWNSLGYHIRALADYDGARVAFERALEIDEAAFGSEHPEVATAVNNLGSVLKDLGDLQGARAAYQRALEIDEAAFGSEHPNVAIRVNNLGGVLQDLGDLQGARAAYERALKIDEAAFGSEHPNVATRVNNLGSVLQDLGDLQGARAAFERALKIDEAAFGSEHPEVATDVNNLGGVLYTLGDLQGARAAFERALKILEKQLGEEHPNVASAVNNLGLVLQDLGDLQGARAAYERALKIWETIYGDNHPQVATGVNNLGSVLRALGDLQGARAAFERALKIDEAAFGSEHPNVAIRVNNLGGVLKDLGDLQGARAAYQRALKIFEKFLPPDHPSIKTVRGNLDGLNDR